MHLMNTRQPSSVSACARVLWLWGIYVPLTKIRLKTSQLRLVSSWLPFEASLCTAERWPAKCFVLQCWFCLGQRAQSLLEGLRGDDDRCTARQMLKCSIFISRKTWCDDVCVYIYSSYVAMFPYAPRKEDELELRKGEMFLVLERCQDGWFKGTSMHTGKIGVFPGNYMSPVSRSVSHCCRRAVFSHLFVCNTQM